MLKPEEIKTIIVCGAGTMGSGIAQLSIQSGFKTILYDLNSEILDIAQKSIEKGIAKLIEKGKIPEDQKEQILNNITYTSDTQKCKGELIIEAIIENLDIKSELLCKLAEINKTKTIIASNTSSLYVTDIAQNIAHPERVSGLHFFNPAPIMKLVEVVKAKKTSSAVIDTLVSIAKKMGKTPVVCKDEPGFIVNRVARNFYLESLRLLELGHSNVETVDALMEATGFKMGPFRLMDLIGNDVNYAVSQSLYHAFSEHPRFRPSYIQADLVGRGDLGRKTGKGYYQY